MKNRVFIIFLLLVVFPAFGFCQKAYEAGYYKGSTFGMTLKFKLADGYIGACEIISKDKKTNKKSRFLPEEGAVGEDKKLKFYHYSAVGKKFDDYFILEGMEEAYGSLPAEIRGKYYLKGVGYEVRLSKL